MLSIGGLANANLLGENCCAEMRQYLKFSENNLNVLCCVDMYLTPLHLRIAQYDDMHSEDMTISFARCLKRSRQLQALAQTCVFGGHTFDINTSLEIIIATKRIDRNTNKLALVNIRLCLGSLNFVNSVCAEVTNLKQTTFDPANAAHMKLLDDVWNNLRPEVRRRPLANAASPIASEDWGEIGFQGLILCFLIC